MMYIYIYIYIYSTQTNKEKGKYVNFTYTYSSLLKMFHQDIINLYGFDNNKFIYIPQSDFMKSLESNEMFKSQSHININNVEEDNEDNYDVKKFLYGKSAIIHKNVFKNINNTSRYNIFSLIITRYIVFGVPLNNDDKY